MADRKYKLGFIGAGNMAKAIAKAMVDSKILGCNDIIMADPYAEPSYCSITCVKDSSAIYSDCEYVILAIKPQIYREIKSDLAAITADCIISIMAGINIADLSATFTKSNSIVRVMPNSPSMVGSGMTAIADNDGARAHRNFLSSVFGAIGEYLYIAESHFDTVTAISGSGPAYYYMFMQAMIEFAVEHGIDNNTAMQLVCGTARGAANMLSSTSGSIDSLISAVCSKGGTTIEAVLDFRVNNLSSIVKSAVGKARDRSIELSK